MVKEIACNLEGQTFTNLELNQMTKTDRLSFLRYSQSYLSTVRKPLENVK